MKKILNKNGQLFVLDVLFSIIIVFLLFILLSKWSEHQIYYSISQRESRELEFIGHSVYRQIMNNPDYICYVSLSDSKSYISGCVGNSLVLEKEVLGVPDNYSCNITGTNIAFLNNQCTTPIPSNKDLYSVYFNVVRHNSRSMTLDQYQNYLKNFNIAQSNIRLVVWKN